MIDEAHAKKVIASRRNKRKKVRASPRWMGAIGWDKLPDDLKNGLVHVFCKPCGTSTPHERITVDEKRNWHKLQCLMCGHHAKPLRGMRGYGYGFKR